MSKSSIEKTIEKQIKKQIAANKSLAAKQEREAKHRLQIEGKRNIAATIVSGQPSIGNIRLLDKTAEDLVTYLKQGYKGEYVISCKDVNLPDYLLNNISMELEKLKLYGMISNYSCWLGLGWEVSILPCLLTYFEDKEKAHMQSTTNTNNFFGDINGLQIQQGTVNSTQNQMIDQGLKYDDIQKIIDQINKYDSLIETEFGEKASELRDLIVELKDQIEKRDNPRLIRRILEDIKSIALGVGGSLIASGIVTQIQGVL